MSTCVPNKFCMSLLQFATQVPQHLCLSPNLASKRDRYEVLLLIGMPGASFPPSNRSLQSAAMYATCCLVMTLCVGTNEPPASLLLSVHSCWSHRCHSDAAMHLAGSGKSHWADDFIKRNHGHTLLGVNAALDQMRVREAAICFHTAG